jgi:hypothetical protein
MLSQIRERKVDQLISINLELVYHDYWHSRDPLGESSTHLSSSHASLWSKLNLHERFLLRFYTNEMRFQLGQIQSLECFKLQKFLTSMSYVLCLLSKYYFHERFTLRLCHVIPLKLANRIL